MELYTKVFLLYLVCSGLVKAALISILFFVAPKNKSERHVQRMSNLGGIFDILIVGFFTLLSGLGWLPQAISFGDLLGLHSELVYRIDFISLMYLFFSFLVIGLLGRFSCFYLHKDRYYLKFFFLFYLFQTSTVLLILSDNFVSYFVGWEFLGLSSALLISFYENRKTVVKNSLRIFTLYKISDILLFCGFAVAFASSDFQLFSQLGNTDIQIYSVYVFLTSLAIMIKMGGLPVIWLPRAMEGPTPSSAIFYGALATHIPLLLFIKLWSTTNTLPWVHTVLVCLSIIVILTATLQTRTQVDAKNALAYATVKHIFIIAIEMIFGFISLAYIHILLHCFYRLFQFIRTPSLLYEYHQMESYNGNTFDETGLHFNKLFPLSLRKSLYRLVLRDFYFMPRAFRIIDILMGMTNRITIKKVIYILLFNFALLMAIIMVQWVDLHQMNETLFLLVLPWLSALIVLLLNVKGWRSLAAISLSILSLLSVIFFAGGYINFFYTEVIEFVLFLTLIAFFIFGHKTESLPKERGKKEVAIFALTLWFVGVPGPGTWYIFEKAIHQSLQSDFYLSIGAFVILSINTLSVVKNYLLEDSNFIRRSI